MRKPKIFGNRKAEVPDFISDIFSFFLYLLFFMMFFILFSLSFGGCTKLESQSQRILGEWDADLGEGQFQLNYLRTNLSIEGRQMTYAGLIAESCIANNYEKIQEKTAELMGQGLEGIYELELGVKCDPDREREIKLYRSEPPASCPYRLICAEDGTEQPIMIPFMRTDGQASYATLIMRRCEYVVQVSSGMPYPVSASREILKQNGCIK